MSTSWTFEMRETQPKVWLIAQPILHWETIFDYLAEVEGTDWYHRVRAEAPPDAEALIEFAGRLCYRSWIPGLNANVTKVREDRGSYLENILKSKHGSVLEHANLTFLFQDVSRVFTHELVRHRAGVAISQESLRYVRLTDLGFRIPDVLLPQRSSVIEIVERLEELQVEMADAFGLDNDGVPFHVKKEVTSALRRLAPLGLSTSIVWTANIRTIRHVLEMRTASGAEEEIRFVFDRVGTQVKYAFPLLFQDFKCDETGCWKPKYEKV